MIVAISSNKGLARFFNANVVKAVKYKAKNDYKNANLDLYTLGKKANDVLKKEYSIYKNDTHIYDELSFENTAGLFTRSLCNCYLDERYDKIVLVYNQFKNAGTQFIQHEQFLPIEQLDTDEEKELDYIFEPSKMEIVKDLIPKSLKTQLFKALRDSFASEHGARMTAMHKATDNAKELRDDLKLSYNKARQASITNEILEIVGGAEALNG